MKEMNALKEELLLLLVPTRALVKKQPRNLPGEVSEQRMNGSHKGFP